MQPMGVEGIKAGCECSVGGVLARFKHLPGQSFVMKGPVFYFERLLSRTWRRWGEFACARLL